MISRPRYVSFPLRAFARSMDPFVSSLQGAFYVDADMIRDAIRRRFEFNVLHLATRFKVDVFVPALDLVTRRELSRGTRIDVGDGKTFLVASPEDTIAQKLLQLGGGVSERQWTDALGVLRVRGATLDREYLRDTAEALGVAPLLERLLQEA